MRPIYLTILLAVAAVPTVGAHAQTPPQTARQALLEMLLNNAPGALERHLPDGARKILARGGDSPQMPILRELRLAKAGISANDGTFETFDSGPVLIAADEKRSQHRVEIIVERDDLAGDSDEIELSVHAYAEGQPKSLTVVPRIIISMKQEKEVWTLDEITVALHVPLSDPDYLKGIQKTQDSASESAAASAIRTINTAEVNYGAAYPARGFTCRLSTLGGGGTQEQPSPEHAMLIDDELAAGKGSEYIFAISGCDTPPASRYRATAVPADAASGMRAFCSDESGVLRYAADGKAASCLSEGAPLDQTGQVE